MIAQDLIAHEAIYKPSKLLDQFTEGLKKLPVYNLMERFPEQFLPLFTYTGNITADDVVDALYVHKDTEMQPDDELTMKFLKRYLFQCDQEGNDIPCPKPPKVDYNIHHDLVSKPLCV